jgi:DNA-binding NarL/FixJ family response regulator
MKLQKAGATEMTISRVLVVDDLELWREFVVSRLTTEPGLQVVGTASDGLEAVRRAEELQPDLILLDVRIPKLTGIEAARQIRKLSAHSKILFLSGESDPEVVKAALDTGAVGFVLKSDAARGLLAGLATVLHGRRFISRSLLQHGNLISGPASESEVSN